MSDKQQSAIFPAPPPFYKHFTNANLQQLQQRGRQQSIEEPDSATTPNNILQLPPELRYLVPPQPPADGRWRTFGYQHDLNAPDPSLEEAGIAILYPDHPSIKLAPHSYLLALARSLLATFLSICGILAQNPGLYEQKVKDLRDMVFNMHDLINQYRPHQARESLILMMEERVEKLRHEIKTIEELKGKIHKSMDGIHQVKDVQVFSQIHVPEANNESESVDVRQAQQRTAWRMLDTLAATSRDSKSVAVEAV